MVARCRSNCANNKSPASCNTADKCVYTNGAVRKYCRLSSKFKMNKPDCNITRKFLKREKGPAEKIRRFLEKKHTSRKRSKKPDNTSSSSQQLSTLDVNPSPLNLISGPTEEEIKEFTNKVHTRKLERFMRKLNPGKIRENRARYLNGVCSDSGVCIAFGTHINKIKKHFGGFVKFDHVKSLKKIGVVSANGFVKEIEYEHEGYKSHAVLKSSADKFADNLYYEYLVGVFINAISKGIPNFVETYGVYKYNSELEYQEMRKLTATKDDLSALRLIRTPSEQKRYIAKHQHQKEVNLLSNACKNSKHISVLIQHINGAKTLSEKCQSVVFVKYELPFILFQVYWALFVLQANFTHYDLHTENVLIYEPVKDAYIQYFYHFKDGSVIAFKSSYIAKMIDYGRSYYDYGMDPATKTQYDIESESKDIYNTICKLPECKPKCGYNFGFSNFQPGVNISSQKWNTSQDLRLLYMLRNGGVDFGGVEYNTMCANVKIHNTLLHELCKKVEFKTMYDTPENTVSGYPAKINNVDDAFLSIKDLVQNPGFVSKNASVYNGFDKLGEMHIYQDRPLEFISAV